MKREKAVLPCIRRSKDPVGMVILPVSIKFDDNEVIGIQKYLS